jgi:transforming growth factor-beta-induced protein
MRNLKLAVLVTVFAVVVAACGSSGEETTTTSEAAADPTTTAAAEPTTTMADTTETTEMMDEETGDTVADIAASNDDFSTLLAAVEAAGLTDALGDPNATLTVFAPTNAAFEAALAELGMTADELLSNTDLLTGILTYHVLGDIVTSGDIAAAGTEEIPVETLSGEELIVIVGDAGNVTFKDQAASVTTADVEASNGVIHIIDGVLLPPSDS